MAHWSTPCCGFASPVPTCVAPSRYWQDFLSFRSTVMTEEAAVKTARPKCTCLSPQDHVFLPVLFPPASHSGQGRRETLGKQYQPTISRPVVGMATPRCAWRAEIWAIKCQASQVPSHGPCQEPLTRTVTTVIAGQMKSTYFEVQDRTTVDQPCSLSLTHSLFS